MTDVTCPWPPLAFVAIVSRHPVQMMGVSQWSGMPGPSISKSSRALVLMVLPGQCMARRGSSQALGSLPAPCSVGPPLSSGPSWGQAFKNALAPGPPRKSISRLQPAALPSAWPSCGCCDSKTWCHGNGCASPEQAARESVCAVALVLCWAWPGLAQGWRKAPRQLFCRETREPLPCPRQEAAWLAHAPLLSPPGLPARPRLLPQIASPGPAGRERGGWGRPEWASELAGASLCKQHGVCILGLARALLAGPGVASGASLLLWFQAFLGVENRNQPCVLQAAKLLRNSCLSPGTGTSFSCRPLAPCRDWSKLLHSGWPPILL